MSEPRLVASPDTAPGPAGRKPETVARTRNVQRPGHLGGAAYLTVRDLTVSFPTADGVVRAVQGLSYSLPLGRTLAIVGESGSGKSVSSMAIMGLHDPKSTRMTGSIQLGGHEIVGMSQPELRRHRGRRGGNDLPGPAVVAAPVLHHRQPDHRGLPGAPQRVEAGRPGTGGRHARPGRHPQPAAPAGRLPAPVLRRHAAARDDRDGAGERPEAAHRRRADHRARRHRAGADPRPDHGPATRLRLGGPVHHPRPRRGRRDRRRHPGHVRRTRGRVRPGRRDPRHAAAPVHLGTAREHPGGVRRTDPAAPDPRHCRRACSRCRSGCSFHPRCEFPDRVPGRRVRGRSCPSWCPVPPTPAGCRAATCTTRTEIFETDILPRLP